MSKGINTKKSRLIIKQKPLKQSFLFEDYPKDFLGIGQTQVQLLAKTSKQYSMISRQIIYQQIIQSKYYTYDSNNMINSNQLDTNYTQIQTSKFIQGEKVIKELLKDAFLDIKNSIQELITNWDQYLNDQSIIIKTIKIVQRQYQEIKNKLKPVIQASKFQQFFSDKFTFPQIIKVDFTYPTPSDLVDVLFKRYPKLQNFFNNFDPTVLTQSHLAQLQSLNAQTISEFLDLNQIKNNLKKKKKKNKKKNKRKSSSTGNQQIQSKNNQDCYDQRFNSVIELLENLSINDQKRVQCRVTDQWLQKLQKQTIRIKLFASS